MDELAMAEQQITYRHRDLVALMLKAQGIHEGHWMLTVTFGFTAINVDSVGTPGDEPKVGADVFPAAVIPITSIGITRKEKPEGPCFNAAELNPRQPGSD